MKLQKNKDFNPEIISKALVNGAEINTFGLVIRVQNTKSSAEVTQTIEETFKILKKNLLKKTPNEDMIFEVRDVTKLEIETQKHKSRRTALLIPEEVKVNGYDFWAFRITKNTKPFLFRVATFVKNLYYKDPEDLTFFTDLGFDEKKGIYIYPDVCFRQPQPKQPSKDILETNLKNHGEPNNEEASEIKVKNESDEPELKKKVKIESDSSVLLFQTLFNKSNKKWSDFFGIEEEEDKNHVITFDEMHSKKVTGEINSLKNEINGYNLQLAYQTNELERLSNLKTQFEYELQESKKVNEEQKQLIVKLTKDINDLQKELIKFQEEKPNMEIEKKINEEKNKLTTKLVSENTMVLNKLTNFVELENKAMNLISHQITASLLAQIQYIDNSKKRKPKKKTSENITLLAILNMSRNLAISDLEDLKKIYAQLNELPLEQVTTKLEELIAKDETDESIIIKFPQLLLKIQSRPCDFPCPPFTIDQLKEWQIGNLPLSSWK